ncbi:hypothetical protein EDC27_0888 [Desulfosoma caldarium]|uniref:Uncharacterized protein n=1 Tax=Desulfosoma caldarium TaxID=610254 RepID=A0A3N1VFQ6_9BACT|nr:hypothetical protein EDC27_0888 [Desulfosoma caldarium]
MFLAARSSMQLCFLQALSGRFRAARPPPLSTAMHLTSHRTRRLVPETTRSTAAYAAHPLHGFALLALRQRASQDH